MRDLSPTADVEGAFVDTVRAAFAARPNERFVLVLSGGPTARRCYERLSAADDVEWPMVDVYVGDERFVPADDPDANQRLIRESLIDPVGGVGSFVPMPTGLGDATACAAAYQEVIAGVLAGSGIDVIHLGMGTDGHTASLFAGAPALDAGPNELVVATDDPNGRNPHPRLTVTLPVIDRARLAVFTVAGESKQDAVAKLRAGVDLPAARVRSADVRWLIDAAAVGDGVADDGTAGAGAAGAGAAGDTTGVG